MTTIRWHRASTSPSLEGWKICVVDNDGEPYVRPLYYFNNMWHDDDDVMDGATDWIVKRWADMPKVKTL